MSALGQKPTFCDAGAMSALPPKADTCSALVHVRFVPIADIRRLVFLARYSRAHGLSSDLNIASISTPSSDSRINS